MMKNLFNYFKKINMAFKDSDIRNFLAIINNVLSFVFLFALLFVEIPEKNETIINIAVGSILVSSFANIINYFFGSSKKQDEKNTTNAK